LVVSSSEIELLGPISSVFEASVRSFSGLFGQSLGGSPVSGRPLVGSTVNKGE
jgi:hypothetical protein